MFLGKSFKSIQMSKLIILNEPAHVNESALTLVSALFYGRIVELEKQSQTNIVFSKQMQLKEMETEIKHFVEANPYSIFEICILGEDNDINHPWTLIEFRNYVNKKEDKEPHRYRLTINDNWGELEKYQDSVDSLTFMRIHKNKRK